ncbi:12566_t:CDS:2 [Dentiscutata heterogama]|uniref:12566_t:CDS:1 n=1 Tax=Dentiscutata heterogama TaxID=1316150 RepID=A0ACA9LUP4_9GLOM|nr:12566_t:CDS:2 [Dentiscutata heterogama]
MPRKNHHNKTLNRLKAKLRLDNVNGNEISKENYELKHSNLKKLEAQFNSLISKIIRLENDMDFYQIENNELKEKLHLFTNSYEDNKTELESYYKVIQKTYSVLEGIVNSNEIDLLQLVDLSKELSEICGAVMIFNSFDDALSASEPKISEINEGEGNNNGQIVPPLVRSAHFYDKSDQNFDTDKFKF